MPIENKSKINSDIEAKRLGVLNTLYSTMIKQGIITETFLTDEALIDKQKEQYKNTLNLLNQYRTIVYSLVATNVNVANDLNCKSLQDVEDKLCCFGDYAGYGEKLPKYIKERLKNNSSTLELLYRLLEAVSILRKKPSCYNPITSSFVSGEELFAVLYYCYLELPLKVAYSFKLLDEATKKAEERKKKFDELRAINNDIPLEDTTVKDDEFEKCLLDNGIPSSVFKIQNETEGEFYADYKDNCTAGNRTQEEIREILHLNRNKFKELRAAAIVDLGSILWGGVTRDIANSMEWLMIPFKTDL